MKHPRASISRGEIDQTDPTREVALIYECGVSLPSLEAQRSRRSLTERGRSQVAWAHRGEGGRTIREHQRRTSAR